MSEYEQGGDELELEHGSEEDYRVLFELAGVGMAQVDPTSTRLLRINPAMCGITGCSEGELLSRTFSELTHPDDREDDLEGFRRVVRGEVPKYVAEKRYVRKDDSVVWVRVETTLVRERPGGPLRTVALIQDITERKDAEEALKESEERFRLLIENSSDVISVFDASGTVLYQSPSIEGVLGHKPEDRIGKNIFETPLVHLSDFDRKRDFFSRVVNGGPGAQAKGEFRLRHSDGSWRHIEAVGKNLLADPRVRGIVTNYRDITEHVRAEEELRSSREQLEIILEGVADGISVQDLTGKLIYANEAAARMLGYRSAEALLEEPLEEVMRKFGLSDETGNPFPLDRLPGRLALKGEHNPEALICFEGMPKDHKRWSLVKARPVFDEAGRVRFAVNIFRDVTESRQAEEVRLRLAAIVENSDDAIIGKTLEGIITSWNRGAQKLYGYSAEEVVGKPIDILVPEDRPEEIAQILENIRRGEAVEHFETGRITKDGKRLDISLTVSPVKDRSGRIAGASTIARDITERKQAEEKIRKVREAERQRMARELHDGALQDLTYALAETQLVQRNFRNEDQEPEDRLEWAVEALKRAGRELRAAVYELGLERERERPLVEATRSLVELNRRMVNPDCEVVLEIEDELPAAPLGENTPELLRILQEALTNARRHSDARSIRVAAGTSGAKLWAQISDDGVGFDPEATSGGGAGLKGMHERASALGGELEIESRPGEGTKVRLELALNNDSPQTEEETLILLVEDHASFREAVATVFEKEEGFVIVGQAGSLSEARAMLEGVDVAVVDLALADGYGGEIIKELRDKSPQAQALVLSSTLERSGIARAVEAGAAGVLHKSAGIEEVVQGVKRLRAGEPLLSLQETVELLRFASSKRDQDQQAQQAIASLTSREKEVLQALGEGLDSPAIAERLNISVETERNHMARILTKLGVHSRLQALVFALRHGVVELP